MASLADNTLLTANELGVLSDSLTINESFTDADSIDYFRFTLSENADLGISFSGLSTRTRLIADLNGNGLVENNEVIRSQFGNNETIFEPLPAGTYFLSLTTSSSSDLNPYTLQIVETTKPGNLPSDPGPTLGEALDLGRLSGRRTLSDYVGTLDPLDVYKFTLTQKSNVAIILAAATDGLPVSIIEDLNNNGIQDAGERIQGLAGSETSVNLEAGSYFLKVGSDFGSAITNYQINLNQVPDFTGNDRIVGTARRDVLRGFEGNDILLGLGGDDRLSGDAGRDALIGGAGNDALFGGDGSDRLFGEGGNDILVGGSGNDFMDGGAGNDVIVSGLGRDRIVLGLGRGFDRVTDFQNNGDKIDLVGIRFGQLTLRQQQNDTLIQFGRTNLMVLENTRVGQITSTDFV